MLIDEVYQKVTEEASVTYIQSLDPTFPTQEPAKAGTTPNGGTSPQTRPSINSGNLTQPQPSSSSGDLGQAARIENTPALEVPTSLQTPNVQKVGQREETFRRGFLDLCGVVWSFFCALLDKMFHFRRWWLAERIEPIRVNIMQKDKQYLSDHEIFTRLFLAIYTFPSP
jgi:hypothetical protein